MSLGWQNNLHTYLDKNKYLPKFYNKNDSHIFLFRLRDEVLFIFSFCELIIFFPNDLGCEICLYTVYWWCIDKATAYRFIVVAPVQVQRIASANHRNKWTLFSKCEEPSMKVYLTFSSSSLNSHCITEIQHQLSTSILNI